MPEEQWQALSHILPVDAVRTVTILRMAYQDQQSTMTPASAVGAGDGGVDGNGNENARTEGSTVNGGSIDPSRWMAWLPAQVLQHLQVKYAESNQMLATLRAESLNNPAFVAELKVKHKLSPPEMAQYRELLPEISRISKELSSQLVPCLVHGSKPPRDIDSLKLLLEILMLVDNAHAALENGDVALAIQGIPNLRKLLAFRKAQIDLTIRLASADIITAAIADVFTPANAAPTAPTLP